MLRPLYFTILYLAAGDECGLYVSKYLPSDTATSFCNDLNFCDGIFFDENRKLVVGATGNIVESKLVFCDEAFTSISKIERIPMDTETHTRAMPRLFAVGPVAMQRAKVEDSTWEAFSKLSRMRIQEPMTADADVSRAEAWLGRNYPHRIEESMKTLEQRVDLTVGALEVTFPRVNDESLPAGWASEVVQLVRELERELETESNVMQIRSIFRNSDAMRRFQWCMRMVMEYGIKMREKRLINAYFQSVSPFVYVFAFIQFRFRIDYPNLYRGMQDFVVEISQIAPPVAGERWEWRVSKAMLDSWQTPEFPLLIVSSNEEEEDYDWPTFLQDAGVSPSPTDRKRKRHYFYTTDVLSTIESLLDSGQMDKKLLRMLAALLHFADRTDLDISQSVCGAHKDFLENVLLTSEHTFPASHVIPTMSAVLNRCRILDLSARMRVITTIAQTVPVLELSHLMLPRDNQLEIFLTRLSVLYKHQLAGAIKVGLYTESYLSDEEAEEKDDDTAFLPGGIASWYGNLVDELFSSGGGYMRQIEGVFTPIYTESIVEIEKLRGIGRFLALYLREGYTENKLSQYYPTDCSLVRCSKNMLFFGSESIRKGFYDVFVENDFELALIMDDASDIQKMLQFVSKTGDNPRFFASSSGSLESL